MPLHVRKNCVLRCCLNVEKHFTYMYQILWISWKQVFEQCEEEWEAMYDWDLSVVSVVTDDNVSTSPSSCMLLPVKINVSRFGRFASKCSPIRLPHTHTHTHTQTDPVSLTRHLTSTIVVFTSSMLSSHPWNSHCHSVNMQPVTRPLNCTHTHTHLTRHSADSCICLYASANLFIHKQC